MTDILISSDDAGESSQVLQENQDRRLSKVICEVDSSKYECELTHGGRQTLSLEDILLFGNGMRALKKFIELNDPENNSRQSSTISEVSKRKIRSIKSYPRTPILGKTTYKKLRPSRLSTTSQRGPEQSEREKELSLLNLSLKEELTTAIKAKDEAFKSLASVSTALAAASMARDSNESVAAIKSKLKSYEERHLSCCIQLPNWGEKAATPFAQSVVSYWNCYRSLQHDPLECMVQFCFKLRHGLSRRWSNIMAKTETAVSFEVEGVQNFLWMCYIVPWLDVVGAVQVEGPENTRVITVSNKQKSGRTDNTSTNMLYQISNQETLYSFFEYNGGLKDPVQGQSCLRSQCFFDDVDPNKVSDTQTLYYELEDPAFAYLTVKEACARVIERRAWGGFSPEDYANFVAHHSVKCRSWIHADESYPIKLSFNAKTLKVLFSAKVTHRYRVTRNEDEMSLY
jgi:hypothetical protein